MLVNRLRVVLQRLLQEDVCPRGPLADEAGALLRVLGDGLPLEAPTALRSLHEAVQAAYVVGLVNVDESLLPEKARLHVRLAMNALETARIRLRQVMKAADDPVHPPFTEAELRILQVAVSRYLDDDHHDAQAYSAYAKLHSFRPPQEVCTNTEAFLSGLNTGCDDPGCPAHGAKDAAPDDDEEGDADDPGRFPSAPGPRPSLRHPSAEERRVCRRCRAVHGPGNTNTMCPLASNFSPESVLEALGSTGFDPSGIRDALTQVTPTSAAEATVHGVVPLPDGWLPHSRSYDQGPTPPDDPAGLKAEVDQRLAESRVEAAREVGIMDAAFPPIDPSASPGPRRHDSTGPRRAFLARHPADRDRGEGNCRVCGARPGEPCDAGLHS
jgi:hypothetical protein